MDKIEEMPVLFHFNSKKKKIREVFENEWSLLWDTTHFLNEQNQSY